MSDNSKALFQKIFDERSKWIGASISTEESYGIKQEGTVTNISLEDGIFYLEINGEKNAFSGNLDYATCRMVSDNCFEFSVMYCGTCYITRTPPILPLLSPFEERLMAEWFPEDD